MSKAVTFTIFWSLTFLMVGLSTEIMNPAYYIISAGIVAFIFDYILLSETSKKEKP